MFTFFVLMPVVIQSDLHWNGSKIKNIPSFGFQILTAVIKNLSVFWDITLCNSVKLTDAKEVRIASIFRVQEQAKQDNSMK
jgi:hypothetical protein